MSFAPIDFARELFHVKEVSGTEAISDPLSM